MTFNITNVGFKGSFPTPAITLPNFTSETDLNDIFYYLGTKYNTSNYTNPAGTEVIISGVNNSPSVPTSTLINRSWDTNDFSSSFGRDNFTGNLDVIFNFTKCKILPTHMTCRLFHANNGSISNLSVLGSNDGNNYTLLNNSGNHTPSNVTSNTADYTATLLNNTIKINKYYKYIKVTGVTGLRTNLGFTEFNIWGKLFRTDNGDARLTPLVNTVEQLPQYEANNLKDGDLLYYSSGLVTNKRNRIYETIRLVLTGNITLTNSHFPNYYLVNPNGAVRTITLPTNPINNPYFKIKTLNTSFPINILEVSTTIGILNFATPLIELFHDGVNWTIISQG